MNLNIKLSNTVFFSALFGIVLSFSTSASTDYPDAIKHWQNEGVSIVSEFEAPNGMKGYTGMYEGVGVTLYLLADQKHVLWGELYDTQGNDLSAVALEKAIYAPMAEKLWANMHDSQWIQDGNKDAKQIVYVFTDPNCPYCRNFWQASRPWVDKGEVQLRHILVGILADDSSAKAAAILTSQDPSAVFNSYEKAKGDFPLTLPTKIDDKTLGTLESHLQLMDALGANATPAIYYLNPEGRLQQQLGMPDEKQLKAIMGE